MPEVISLLGQDISVYGLCYVAGILLAAGVALGLCRKRGIERVDGLGAVLCAVIAGLLGAKLLYVAVSFRQIAEGHIPFLALLKGGFVFYGGLIGGALGLLLYSRWLGRSFWEFAGLFAVVLPLGHAVGRVGCFAAGCCYGIPYHGPFSHTYTHLQNSDLTPLGVPLLPVQLIEAAALLLLFVGLLIGFLRRPKAQKTFVTAYVLAYSAIRFTLEFFRGDGVRGVYFGLSTSQWISLAAFVLTIIWLIVRRRRAAPASDTPTEA